MLLVVVLVLVVVVVLLLALGVLMRLFLQLVGRAALVVEEGPTGWAGRASRPESELLHT
jgi:hypothetical protein